MKHYQLIIFIRLFISQYSKFKKKITFFYQEGNKEIDDTKESILDFAKSTKYFTKGGFIKLLMNKNESKDKKKNYIDLLSDNYDDDLKSTKFDVPLIFINKEKKEANFLMIPETSSKKYQSSKDYLQKLKEIMGLPNEVENDKDKEKIKLKSLLSILDYKTDNYVITNDNFKKMVLILYRIQAKIPVIIMGETGCGKTALIIKLNQILNNGEITVKKKKYTSWDY